MCTIWSKSSRRGLGGCALRVCCQSATRVPTTAASAGTIGESGWLPEDYDAVNLRNLWLVPLALACNGFHTSSPSATRPCQPVAQTCPPPHPRQPPDTPGQPLSDTVSGGGALSTCLIFVLQHLRPDLERSLRVEVDDLGRLLNSGLPSGEFAKQNAICDACLLAVSGRWVNVPSS